MRMIEVDVHLAYIGAASFEVVKYQAPKTLNDYNIRTIKI